MTPRTSMRPEWALGAVSLALVMWCRGEPEPEPPATPPPAPERSADEVPQPVIEALGVVELGGEGLGMDAVGDGVVAWSRGGLFLVDDAGAAEQSAVYVSPDARDAALSADGLWVAEGSGASATRHEAGGTATFALAAGAHDLWVDGPEPGAHAWFATQGADGGEVVALASDGATVMREHVGRSPVALVPSPDGLRVAVASMRGRELTVFDTASRQVAARVPLSFGPVTAVWIGADRVAAFPVGAGRAALLTLSDGAPPQVEERPIEAPTYLAAGLPQGDGLIAASSAAMALVRYDAELEVKAQAALDAVPFALAVGDVVWVADGSPAVVGYDAESLDVLARYALPAPASRVVARGDVAWVLVPLPGLVATLRLSVR